MKKTITVKCFTCEQDFEKSKGKYNKAFKLNSNPVFYCGRKCFHSKRRDYQPKADKIKVECG